MNNTYACPNAAGDDVVHRYVAGTLEPAEVQAFEEHLLDCVLCQEQTRLGASVRAGLRAPAAKRRPAVLGGAALLAAALVVWLLVPREDPITRLGRVGNPPHFSGLPVRSEPDSVASIVDRGMAAYSAGDYRRAATLLASAASAHRGPGVFFYLGIARLLAGDARGALDALGSALDPPGNPYVPEARLYRAKAWLKRGQADSALVEINAVPMDAGAVRASARALADSVREATRQ